ncbi:hypothetical protein Patl1_34171 [Pistacia atlantica]|uniref:Uncharacterized protein n=1 Tax=Pistacia atlantica TaxID=434234 RepID=A0ACC0ZUQ4_9ROSI|nr:hypothetical protein Patl1_34171 [Pistacia atlantica]
MYTILSILAGRGRNEILFSFLFLIFLLGASYSQTDILLQGQLLKDGDQLVSTFGNFRLGFFSPKDTRNRYLGIWYYRPKDRSSLPDVYQDTYCNIYCGALSRCALNKRVQPVRVQPVWVANRNYPISDKSGKLIIDRADGNLKILHSKGNPIHSSSFINSESDYFSYKFRYTTNEQEKYFSYSVNEDDTSFPILKISSSGHLMDDVGSFVTNGLDYDRYCEEGNVNFHSREGFMSGEGFKFKEIDNMTLDDCQAKCMKNCSCVAFASANSNNNTGCEIWSRGTKFVDSFSSNYRKIYMKMEDFGPPKPKGNNWRQKLIIGVVVALAVPLLFFLCYRIRRKYKAKGEVVAVTRNSLSYTSVMLFDREKTPG